MTPDFFLFKKKMEKLTTYFFQNNKPKIQSENEIFELLINFSFNLKNKNLLNFQFLKKKNKNNFLIFIQKNEKILKLKLKIKQIFLIEIERISLLFKGQILDDNEVEKHILPLSFSHSHSFTPHTLFSLTLSLIHSLFFLYLKIIPIEAFEEEPSEHSDEDIFRPRSN